MIRYPGDRLPQPDPAALAHSQRVVEALRNAISGRGGAIGFDGFMEIALYSPGLGYYSAGARKLGAGGDFVTAPEISPIFSRCVAAQCAQALAHLGGGTILELGAGSGAMACDLLGELARRETLPETYFILELSADLRERQQSRVRAAKPELANRVKWLDALPVTPLRGVILANEVLDALPAARFRLRNGVPMELAVEWDGGAFRWIGHVARTDFDPAIMALLRGCPDGYVSEWRPCLTDWIRAVAATLDAGLLLFVDYGHPRREYYHPQRADGTLRCHYRHRAHDDPFLWPGLQDITAAVDFTAVAQAADAAGMALSGFTTQAHFLIGCGLEPMFADLFSAEPGKRADLSRQIQLLTLPGEMGEVVKAMALTRDLHVPLIGFSGPDHRHRL